MNIATEFKKQLGDLLGEYYRKFGKVAPRRPYHEDDKEGGSGEGGAIFESHPLLAEQPIGASSDLTSIITENSNAKEEAEKRHDELTLQLQKQLDLTKQPTKAATPIPSPIRA